MCNSVYSISEKITENIGVPQLLVTIVIDIIVFGIVGVLLLSGGKLIFELYKKYCFDESGLLISLVIIAVLVWFADIMPLNVVLMLIISQPLHIGVRWYMGYKKNHH